MSISRFSDRMDTIFRFLIVFLVLLIGGWPTLVYALPQGGAITSGTGTIDTSGPSLTVTQTTNKIIINWESFSIGNNESVIFVQPDSSSSALNNVLGTSRTVVEGNLSGNGQIVLSNPNGIFISPDANVNVASLIASTLKISEQDFLDGLYQFSQDPSKPLASILNEGKIRASDFAALIAPSVDNKGVVIANLGTVGLVSGKAATVDFVGDNLIKFTVNEPVEGQVLDKDGNLINDRISNSGSIQADGGQVILSAKNASSIIKDVVNMDGVIEAKTVTEKNGRIFLGGGDQGSVRVAGTLNASGEEQGEQGGEITIEGATVTTYNASIQADSIDAKGGDINITGNNWVSATGTIDASGKTGGNVNITTGDLDISAPILAKGTTGQGGNININTLFKSWEVVNAMLDVSGASGGSIKHFADQQIVTSGKYLAIGTAGKGGSIDVTAGALKFLSNTIDASGTMGGGSIRLGGEYQGGKNLTLDEIKNAQTLVMTDTTNITAKAMGNDGDGGRIIAWADQGGVVLGQFDATPGAQTGTGGFVEVSSGDVLNFRGSVFTGIGDRRGTLLLDPKNITISKAEVYSQSSLLLGYGYTGHVAGSGGIDDFSETTLEGDDDLYGVSVSLDGNRLAVGATFTDLGNDVSSNRTGTVFLYSFDDSSFSNTTLQHTLGFGRSINHFNNDTDQFGASVSLDTASDGSARLAVGARNSDGVRNDTNPNHLFDNTNNRGTVYLFSFTGTNANNNSFEGGELKAVIGHGYTQARTTDTANAAFYDRDENGLYPNGLDISSHLDTSDNFGQGVSLVGTMLAVGSQSDDGDGDGVGGAGAAYLFNFDSGSTSASSFENPTLVAKIGADYTTLSKSIDETALEGSDQFGHELSLDQASNGTVRLAVVAKSDDGSGNGNADSGAVYLYTFDDTSFTNGQKVGIIGDGYSGAKDIDITINEDDVLSSVSLDGTNLALGISEGDGSGDARNTSGEVYNFSFTDNAFSGGVLEGRMGFGYSKDNSPANYDAAKNRDQEPSHALIITEFESKTLTYTAFANNGGTTTATVSANHNLSNGDTVTISGTTNYNGTYVISGKTNKKFNISAPFVADDATGTTNFTIIHTDPLGEDDSGGHGKNAGGQVVISGTTNYDGTYTIASKDSLNALVINKTFVANDATGIARASNIQGGDRFGQGVSIDNGRLVVGASQGNNFSGSNRGGSGEVYLFPAYADNSSANERLFSTNPSADHTILPSTLVTLLSTPTDVTLQASNDIGFFEAVTVANGDGNGGNLTIQAGRSILINANITTDNGNLTLTANDTVANGVVDAQRDSGNAAITMTTGTTINVGTGTLTATISAGADKTNSGSGDIQLFSVTAATLNVTNNGSTSGSDIIDDNNNDEAFTISGDSTFTTTGDGVITLDNTSGHAFTGAVGLNTGTGNAALVDTNGLDLGPSTVGGTLSATAILGDIVDSDTLTITGAATFITKTDDSDIILDSSGNAFAATVTMQADDGSENFENITFVDSAAVDLDSSASANGDLYINAGTDGQVTGNLSVTAGGDITQNVALAVTGTSSFTTSANAAINLSNTSNALGGAVSFNTTGSDGDATLDNGTTALDLGISTVGGDLEVTSGANITDSGVLTVGGTSTFIADVNDRTIIFNENHAFTGAISFTTTDNETGDANDADVSVTGISGAEVKLGASTVKGDLTVTTSNTTGISDAGILTIHGNSTFTTTETEAAIDLDSANLFTGWVALTTATGGDAKITTGDLALEINTSSVGGTLTVNAGNSITQKGSTSITVEGSTAVTITASAGPTVTLTQNNNNFKGAVSIINGNQMRLDTSGALVIGTITGAWAVLESSGDVTQSADGTFDLSNFFSVDARSADENTFYDVTLTNPGSETTRIKNIFAKNFSYLDSDTSGTLSVGGNITDGTQVTENFTLTTRRPIDDYTHELLVGGTTTITARNEAGTTNYNIVLDSVNTNGVAFDDEHNFATIAVTGANVTLVDTNGIVLEDSTTSGTFAVTATAGGDITDSGALNITGAATFTAAGGQNITLDSNNTFSGTVAFATPSGNLKNVEITDTTTLNLAALTLAQVASAGGNLTVTAGGAVTNDGTLVIPGVTTISASGQDVTLNSANNDFTGNVSITGKVVAVTDTNAIKLGASTISENYTVTAGGAVTDHGTLLITGATTINASGQNVTLDEAASNFIGAVGITGANVAVRDVGAIKLGASDVSGTYTVTAAGEVLNSGALDIEGVTTISATGQDVTLDHASNDFEDDVLITGKIVKVVDADSIDLGTSTVSGDYTVTAGDAVKQSGVLTISGATDITADDGDKNITLNTQTNLFTGAVSLKGHNIRVTEGDALVLGDITTGDILNVTAGGAVTNTGVLDINGITTISASGQDVTLNNPDNDFRNTKAVRITARNVDIVDKDSIKLGVSTVTGTYTVTAGNDVTDDDTTLEITGITTISAENVDLDSSTHNFANEVRITAVNVEVVDEDTIALGASAVSGTYTVTAGGAVTNPGPLLITEVTTITASGQDVTLDEAANNFIGAVGITGRNVEVVDANTLVLGLSNVSGTYEATATVGNITQDLATDNRLSIAGTTTLQTSADAATVNLTNTNNGFTGALLITTNDNTDGADGVYAADVTIDGGTTKLIIGASTIDGNLTLTGGNTADSEGIKDDGTVTVKGNLTVTHDVNNGDILMDTLAVDGWINLVTTGSTGHVTITNDAGLIFKDITVGGDFGATATTGVVTQRDGDGNALGQMDIDGTTTLTISDPSRANVILDVPSNDFTGAVSVVSNANNIAIKDINAINLGAVTAAGTYDVTAGGNITDSGGQVITGAATFVTSGDLPTLTVTSASGALIEGETITGATSGATGVVKLGASLGTTVTYHATSGTFQAETITGGTSGVTKSVSAVADVTIVLDHADNSFGSLNITGNAGATINSAGAIELTGQTLLGNLIVTAGGAVTDTGTWDVTGVTTISASGHDVTLGGPGDDFKGAVSITGANVYIEDTNSILLGAFDVSGTLDVVAGGAVTDSSSGELDIEGITTISAGGQTVTLDHAASDFEDDVKITAANVAIRDVDEMILGASTVSGTYDITAGGAVTDDGPLLITGVTTISASGQTVTLNHTASDFTGAVGITAGNVAVTVVNGIDLGESTVSGTYAVTAGDAITNTGTLDITGITTINASEKNVSLNHASNNFKNEVRITGANVAVRDVGAIVLGPSTVSGTYTVTAGSTVTDSATGELDIEGVTTINASGQTVTLDHAASDFTGAVGITGRNVAVRDVGAIVLGPSTVSGTYTVTAAGAVTDGATGELDIEGVTTISASNQTVTLDHSASDFTGAVVITAENVAVTDVNGIDLGTSTVTGTYTVNAGGTVTDSGTLTITEATTINASNQNVELDEPASNFVGAVGITGANVAVRDVGAIVLGPSTVSGTYTVTAAGAVTDGATGELDIEGVTTINASGQTVTLDHAASDFTGAVEIIAANVAVTDVNGIVLGESTVSGTYTVTAGGVITNSGALDITGITTITGTDITLDHASNDFKNAVRVTTTGSDVVLTDLGAIDLGASTVTGTYTVNAGGTVTDSGTLTITGATTINASNQNVELDESASNFVGAVSITGKNVEVKDANTIELGTSTITGTYEVTATAGDITDNGVLTITSAATFRAAAGQNIILNNNNIFSSAVSFTTPSGNLKDVTITDTTDFDLVTLTLSGDLAVISGGSITQSGALTIGGISSFTTSTNNKTIDLSTITTNAFTGAITITTNDDSGTDADVAIDGGTTKLVIAASTVDGDLTLRTGNADGITDSGTVTVGGNLIVDNDVSNGDINMDSLAVDGTIALATIGSGGNVTLVNDAGLDFAASTIGGDLNATATTLNISDSGTLEVTGATIITLGTNPILSVSGATSATDLDGNTINLDISVFTGGITLRYFGVLPPPDDNSDIDLARQMVFAELVRGLYKNIKDIYGAYEDINEDDIRRMYELFLQSLPKPEKEFKEIKKHLSNEFIIREKKESIAGEDENKEL